MHAQMLDFQGHLNNTETLNISILRRASLLLGTFITNRHYRISVSIKVCILSVMLMFSKLVLACPVENKTIDVSANGHILKTEVATNLEGHMCGLAFRRQMPANHAMLFVYMQDQVLGFWMKNTFIPLSIAFLDSNGKILEIHNMIPLDTSLRYISKSSARYALEVNQGWFVENGISVGDRVEFDLQAIPEIFKYSAQ